MEERKGFGSNFGFLMAAVGSAVGLGNIWGFPNKMGASGGFTFLIIYLILAVCCGFIVMVGELAIGRKTGKGAVAAYKALSKKFSWIGWMGILSAFFIQYITTGGGNVDLQVYCSQISSLISALIIYLCAFVGFFKYFIQTRLRKADERNAAKAAQIQEGGEDR
mgnify:CR=1 FL=1